ncbi:unnamed protein product [Ilex paraguariensis]|uniref:Uncharacterized protein n=1 Tax=Ilex paraguariensis TaxID=185542 RepID=A0ABC8TZJ8_9AQUA
MVTNVAEVTNVFIGDSILKVMIAITFLRPEGSGKLVLDGDEQLQKILSLYRNCKEIHVFVIAEVGSQVGLPPSPDVGIGEEPNLDEINDNEPNGENDDKDANRHKVDDVNGDEYTGGGGENDERDANSHKVDDVNGDEHMSEGGENDDNVYGFSFEDEDWIVEGDDVPNVRYESHDDTINTQLNENSDDGFSDYQSRDEGYVSSTDLKELEAEVDEIHIKG